VIAADEVFTRVPRALADERAAAVAAGVVKRADGAVGARTRKTGS